MLIEPADTCVLHAGNRLGRASGDTQHLYKGDSELLAHITTVAFAELLRII